MTPRNNALTTRGRPFAPGNPGRPKGARHETTIAVESLLEGEAERLTRKAIDMALAGDSTALRLCLERVSPAMKERLIALHLPQIGGIADLPLAFASLFHAIASGEITTGEAASVAALLERYRAVFESTELEARVRALEGGGE